MSRTKKQKQEQLAAVESDIATLKAEIVVLEERRAKLLGKANPASIEEIFEAWYRGAQIAMRMGVKRMPPPWAGPNSDPESWIEMSDEVKGPIFGFNSSGEVIGLKDILTTTES